METHYNSNESDLSPSELKRRKEEEYKQYLNRDVDYDWGQALKGIRGDIMFADQHLDS